MIISLERRLRVLRSSHQVAETSQKSKVGELFTARADPLVADYYVKAAEVTFLNVQDKLDILTADMKTTEQELLDDICRDVATYLSSIASVSFEERTNLDGQVERVVSQHADSVMSTVIVVWSQVADGLLRLRQKDISPPADIMSGSPW